MYVAMAANCIRQLLIITVEPVLFLDSLAYGITETATRVLLYNKVCTSQQHDLNDCTLRNLTHDSLIEVQKETSRWESYRNVATYLPAVFLIIIYANLMDRWSQKYMLLLCPVGSIVSMLVYLVTSVFIELTGPAFMLIGSFVVGLTGGVLTLMGGCFSYLSSTHSTSRRHVLMVHIALAEAFQLASRSISSFASGILLTVIGYVYVYIIGILLNVLLIAYVIIRLEPNIPHVNQQVVDVNQHQQVIQLGTFIPSVSSYLSDVCSSEPEKSKLKLNGTTIASSPSPPPAAAAAAVSDNDSVEMAREVDVTQSTCSQVSSSCEIFPDRCDTRQSSAVTIYKATIELLEAYAKSYLNTIIRRRHSNRRCALLLTLSIISIDSMCVFVAGPGLNYLYLTHSPLSWSTSTYGYYIGVTMFVKAICLLVVLPLCQKMMKTSLMIAGLSSSIISITLLAFSQFTWMAFASAGVALFQAGTVVAARSLIVSFVEKDEHGKLFGIVASLESSVILLSSVIFNVGIYPSTVHFFSGLAILIAGQLLLLPLGLAVYLHLNTRCFNIEEQTDLHQPSIH